MSTESAAAGTGPWPAARDTDLRSARVLRLAVGLFLAAALAFGVGWNLSFITPVFVALLLRSGAPCPPFRAGGGLVLMVAGAMAVGVVISLTLTPYPLVFALAQALLLFWVFFANAGGAPPMLIVMLLVAVTAVPVVAVKSAYLCGMVASGLTVSVAIAVALVWVVHALFPDPAVVRGVPATAGKASGSPTPVAIEVRARQAVLSTIVVLPLALTLLMLEMTGAILVLIYVAILAQHPSVSAGLAGGRGIFIGSLFGGLVALVFHNLLIALPSFLFFLLLTLLLGLVFGERIFFERRGAALFAAGLSTVMILIGSGTAPFGDEADTKFYIRLLQIMLATAYVVGAFSLLEAGAAGRRRRSGREPAT
jgi:hypothetical protein